MDFPRTIDEITPEWLTRVLRESGATGLAKVDSFSSTEIGGGRGAAGHVFRLELNYDSDELSAPRLVIAKLASSDDWIRDFMRTAAGVEVKIFRELGGKTGIKMPKCFFANNDLETGYFCLLLEDLGHLREVDLTDDCSFEDASAAIESLARMHATWWNRDDLPSWLHTPNAEGAVRVQSELENSIDSFIEVARDHVPSGLENIIRNFAPKLAETFLPFFSRPATLNHGDFKLLNLFFDDEQELSNRVVAFDWQASSRWSGMIDVSEFVMSSFSVESRRKYEHELLDLYHSTLLANGVRDYSKDDLILDLRLSLLERLRRRVNNTPRNTSMLASEEGRRNLMARVERLQMVVDWNCEEMIPK